MLRHISGTLAARARGCPTADFAESTSAAPTEALEFWATPGRFTDLGELPVEAATIEEAFTIVQGLFVYDVFAKPFYDVDLTDQQAGTINQRDIRDVLATASAVDARPLGEARPPACRVGARCHLFTKLTVALLRHAGIPAGARCGFGTYFVPDHYEDHWVAECWNGETGRWQMVDAQLDATWCEMVGFTGDPFDMTPTEFVTAGHAWQAWRRGEVDGNRFGLSAIGEHGALWIANNLRLDLAALNKVEMLPWDLWGADFEPPKDPSPELLELFDQVAELTVDPDPNFGRLRDRYDTDDQLRMTGEVFNVQLGVTETV